MLVVFRFSALGDVAMTLPIVESVARRYPDTEILFVSRSFVAPLLKAMPPNVAFLGVDFDTDYRGIGGLLRLARELRRRGATAVADLHNVLRTKVLRTALRLSGVPCASIDKGRAEKKRLCIEGAQKHPLRPTVARYADVFTRLGYAAPMDFSGFRLPPVFPKPKEEWWVGIAPFAAHETKVYPPERMGEAVRELLRRHPALRIFVFGSPKEMAILRPTWDAPAISFVCDLLKGLGDELRLMRQLDAMVSMDSANMHLASLVALPVVSIWGATHPYAGFLGYGQSTDLAVQLDLPCRPCSVYGNRPCRLGDRRCLTQLPPARVVEKIEEALRRSSSRT